MLDLEGIMLSEKSDREGQVLHGLSCMRNLKKKAKLIETESRKVVAKDWGLGEIEKVW